MEIDPLRMYLSTMNVPYLRLDDLQWLRRNLRINNGDHPHIELAMALINDRIKRGE